MPRTYYVIAGNHRTYSHEPKHSFEERVFGSYPSKAKAEEIAKALFFTLDFDQVRVAHKNWNTVKGTKVWTKTEERYNTLKRMNDFIFNDIGDEDYFDSWLMCGIPDGSTDEDLRELATEDEYYKDICECFINIFNRYLQYEEEDITLPVDLYLF